MEHLQKEFLGLVPEKQAALGRWLKEPTATAPTKCPEKLYRYMDAKGIAGLENDELRFFSPTGTKDPFEFLTS